MTDKATTQTIVQDTKLIVDVALPFLPPNVQLALAIVKGAIAAIEAANNGGRDVSDAELDALFAEDERARLADELARRAKQQSTPLPPIPAA